MKTSPTALIIGCFVGSIIVFGLAVRICEAPVYKDIIEDELGGTLASFWTSSWLVILSMTGVGFGDFYPLTTAGRIVTSISCLWGVIVVSLMIVGFQDIMRISGFNENALMVLSRLQVKDAIRQHAGHILTLLARFGKSLVKKGKPSEKIRSKLFKRTGSLKQLRNDYRSMDDQNFREDLARQFSMVREDYSCLNLSLKKQAVFLYYISKELGIQKDVEPHLEKIMTVFERHTFIKKEFQA